MDLVDTSSLSVEDIKIKKEQEMATFFGFLEEERQGVDEKETEEKWSSSQVENKEDAGSVFGYKERRACNRKRGKKALREGSPACDYERIRAANIAERMELLQTLDIEGALA